MSAQELEPPQTVLVNLINLYNQGQFAEAANDAAHLIDKFPKSALLYNIHGASNAGLGRLDFAIKSYKKAKNLKPHYAEVYYNMGMALKKKVIWRLRLIAYRKLLRSGPTLQMHTKTWGLSLRIKEIWMPLLKATNEQ
jgi:tetratricopeptide (TPR) repeat protein